MIAAVITITPAARPTRLTGPSARATACRGKLGIRPAARPPLAHRAPARRLVSPRVDEAPAALVAGAVGALLALISPVGATVLAATGMADAGQGLITIAGLTTLAGRSFAAPTGLHLVESFVVIGPQVPHPQNDDDHDQDDHSGQNDQRGLHGTIQSGVALGDARQSRAAFNASLP